MINSSRRRSLILSSREDEESKKASACGASARASDAFWKRLSTEKKFLLFLWKKVEKKEIFRQSAVTLTLLYGETEEKQLLINDTTNDGRGKKVDSSDGQSSGGESSRGDENERGDFVARNRRK